jgi:hypothetical protein
MVMQRLLAALEHLLQKKLQNLEKGTCTMHKKHDFSPNKIALKSLLMIFLLIACARLKILSRDSYVTLFITY